jgi:hypothetical protein
VVLITEYRKRRIISRLKYIQLTWKLKNPFLELWILKSKAMKTKILFFLKRVFHHTF